MNATAFYASCFRDGLPSETSPSVSLSHLPPTPHREREDVHQPTLPVLNFDVGKIAWNASSLSLWERETEGEVSEGTALVQARCG